MITPIYAGLLAIVLIVLSLRVIRLRRTQQVSLGDAGDETLTRRICTQGNFIEYVPMALVLILLLELSGASVWLLHGLGVALLISRLIHAWSLGAHSGSARVFAMSVTFAVLAVGGVSNLLIALSAS